MKIAVVKAFALRIPRDFADATGTAGSPAQLKDVTEGHSSQYRWAESYKTLYSTYIETTLVRIETDGGIVGWGEAQSPVAPQITTAIIESLLGPVLIGEDALAPEALWERMYSTMRVRGHTGSFLLDAISGLDIAIWDICGKAYGQPIFRLLGGPIRTDMPYYISGLSGANNQEKVVCARRYFDAGARAFKVFLDKTPKALLSLIDDMRNTFGEEIEIFVDALWRLSPKSALQFARQLEAREVGWLEAPLMPEDLKGHQWLTSQAGIPIAIGESYRSRFELIPFFKARAMDILQPDIGRTGITEGRRVNALAGSFHMPIAPHISIGLGPQIAAALHLASAAANLMTIECNPKVYEIADKMLRQPLSYNFMRLNVPTGAGLGIDVNEEALLKFVI